MLLAVAACGGGEQVDGERDTPTTEEETEGEPVDSGDEASDTTGPTETDPEDPDDDDSDGSETDLGPATAVVTVGSETYEFTGLTCVTYDDNSRLTAAGSTSDGATSMNADIFPGGVDQEGLFSVHYVNVRNTEEGFNWSADVHDYPSLDEETIPEGGSQIDSVTIDGGYAVGTATFIDLEAVTEAYRADEPVPESRTGSFEINC